ncbi:uncharacterized protein LOC122246997 isoform X3 [Penaeus japonicus]|uniref:uncharacterized protein LOC122246997 isoform X3 n=1 Tax=Penaeus japonicus TaxID=27405 RepID=UPI001C70D016|nr:uncharacterized protein LOC122246997 isoform X3 [Penaeus japonicus]
MVSAKLLILSVFVAAITAAPQFSNENQPPIPYDFAYGVEVPETGDAKEHKQSASPSGRTDGEYRWLQPNGLYTIVRYYVDGDSGFQAQVSEEPGPAVGNYYANSLSQESASGVVSSTNQGFIRSSNVQQASVGRAVNVISAPRPNQVSFSAPRPNQVSFSTVPRPNQVSLSSNPRTNQGSFFSAPRLNQASFFSAPQPNPVSFSSSFSSQEQSFGGVVDGGFTDGGFIDGGIIDGGIIDGGVING